MKNLAFRTMSTAVNYYIEAGYSHLFDFSSKSMDPASWLIVAVYRFEGFSDPSDSSVLYVLENKSDLKKGILIDSYGAKRNEQMNQFLQSVPRYFPDQLNVL